jgi:hypothetical protein
MKRTSLAISACFITSTLWAAPPVGDAGALQIYPKNLARQHIGANAFAYNATNQTFVPTEGAAAWLDDDVATGWPMATGHQYYMIALPEAELVNNFALSTRGSVGTVSIYAGDEAAAPTSQAWAPLAKDLPVESINQRTLTKSFSRFAKYILIETNLSETGPLYSMYLYGEKPASSYTLTKRSQPLNAQSIFKYINDSTSISISGLYTKSRVTFANATEGSVALQKAIDDNPETFTSVAPSAKESGLIVKLDKSQPVQRISALADATTKGRLDFFLVNEGPAPTAAAANESQYLRAAYEAPAAQPPATAVSTVNLRPAASITFDGKNARGSTDFAAVNASTMLVTWTPETGGQPLALRELNTFSNVGMTNYELTSPPAAVGELYGYDSSKDGKQVLGGKEALPPVGESLPPVGEFLPPKTPFVPGLPPMPPNIPLSAP